MMKEDAKSSFFIFMAKERFVHFPLCMVAMIGLRVFHTRNKKVIITFYEQDRCALISRITSN